MKFLILIWKEKTLIKFSYQNVWQLLTLTQIDMKKLRFEMEIYEIFLVSEH